MIYRTVQGDMLDAICWRVFGRTDGIVEKVLDGNPGLSQTVVFEAGTQIELPDPPIPASVPTIRLWNYGNASI